MEEDVRREIDRLWSVVSRMDDQGTRGVVAVQVQITELIKDFAEFKLEMNARMSQATQNRKWFIGILVTMLGVVGGLVDVAVQVRR